MTIFSIYEIYLKITYDTFIKLIQIAFVCVISFNIHTFCILYCCIRSPHGKLHDVTFLKAISHKRKIDWKRSLICIVSACKALSDLSICSQGKQQKDMKGLCCFRFVCKRIFPEMNSFRLCLLINFEDEIIQNFTKYAAIY